MSKRKTSFCLALVVFAQNCIAQNVIGTFAGTDFLFASDRMLPLSAPLGHVQDVAVDALGNLYISDRDNHVVVQVTPDGTLATYAGNGLNGFSGDQGAAVNASLRAPRGLAIDRAGNLFVADEFSHRVRRIATDGTITTVAGTGIASFTSDGAATSSALNGPRGLALDAAGNLYIADSVNNRIRKVSPAGFMTTFAGTGAAGNNGDGGIAAQASLNTPSAVAVDNLGNVYIATTDRVRKVAPNNTISTLSVTVGQFAQLVPSGLAVDSQNNLYISDSQTTSFVIRVTTNGTAAIIAGSGNAGGFAGDGGPATQALLKNPGGLTVNASNVVFVADRDNLRVRRIDTDGTIRTVAGNGRYQFSGDGQRAASANLSQPVSVAVDGIGNVFVADFGNNRIRRIVADRTIATVAGSDTLGFGGDGGPATQAALAAPQGVAADASGFYVADKLNNAVRKVDLQGIIRTIAGRGGGFSSSIGDNGPATSAVLRFPYALAFDSLGNLYIADQNNDRIRRVATDGTITTVAGGGNSTAEGVLATDAALSSPQGVAVDSQNRIYIADTDNGRIRRVENGRITTIAGGGTASGEGVAAITARLDAPQGLALDAVGNLYFAEFNANRVRRIVSGNVSTVAGILGTGGFSGDGGLALNALLSGPRSVAFDAAGNLYIADSNNNRIRVVFAAPPPVTVSPAAISFSATAGGLRTAPRLVSVVSDQLSGLPFTATLLNKSPWLLLFPAAGPTPVSLEVSADPTNLKAGVYSDTIRITTPNARPPFTDVSVQLTVADAGQPLQSVQPETLAFAFVVNTGPKTQTVTVANLGGGSIGFTAKADTPISTKWLSVTPTTGNATAANPALLSVTATPGTLVQGTYTGTVTVTIGAQSSVVLVTMTISQVEQTIRLSQTGLTITGVSGGTIAPPQSFRVLNTGRGVMQWTASVVARPGARIFLALSPGNGSSDAASLTIPSVTVTANLSGLAVGEYFNQIKVESATALNSPQFISVVLEVLDPSRDPGPVVQPSELVFTGLAGASPPSSQDLLAYNLKGAPLNYRSQKTTANGIDWINYLPTEASVDPKSPRRLVVQPDTTLLGPGVQQGVLTMSFDDGSTRKLNILAVVLPVPPSNSSGSLRAAQSACVPKDLVLSVPVLGQAFSVPVGFPTSLVVAVSDDCRNPIADGSVVVNFSNGDLPLSLLSVGDGTWTATWSPRNNASNLKLTVTAQSKVLGITKTLDLGGSTRSTAPGPKIPTINSGGIVNAANPSATGKNQPLAPGGIISIFGSDLANGTESLTNPPFGTTLGGTTVVVAGQELPLTFASPAQVNAILPYGLNPNTDYPLLVAVGNRVSDPVKIVLSPAQPVIFDTVLGPAIVDINYRILTAQNPTHPGDTLVVFATGLGAVLGTVTPGAAPGALLTAAELTVQIGGVPATVSYAGLSPQFPGLYQVNVEVPKSVAAGSVPLVMTILGQPSPEVRIPVTSVAGVSRADRF